MTISARWLRLIVSLLRLTKRSSDVFRDPIYPKQEEARLTGSTSCFPGTSPPKTLPQPLNILLKCPLKNRWTLRRSEKIPKRITCLWSTGPDHTLTFLTAICAQFMYVGAQVGTWSYFIQSAARSWGSSWVEAGVIWIDDRSIVFQTPDSTSGSPACESHCDPPGRGLRSDESAGVQRHVLRHPGLGRQFGLGTVDRILRNLRFD